jgi:hypothetical protein
MALASLVAITGPKKVSISGPTLSNGPRNEYCPHQNHNIPRHIHNRYINSYIVFSGGMTELGCDSIDKLKAKLHSLDKGNIYIYNKHQQHKKIPYILEHWGD